MCFDKEGMGMYRVISGRFLQRETELLAAIALEIPVAWDVRPRGMISNSRGSVRTYCLDLRSSAPISSLGTLYLVQYLCSLANHLISETRNRNMISWASSYFIIRCIIGNTTYFLFQNTNRISISHKIKYRSTSLC
jgi:hypothetical protein